MKKIILLVTLFCVSVVNAQKTDLEQEHLFGKVKSTTDVISVIIANNTWEDGQEPVSTSANVHINEYNPKGFKIKHSMILNNGTYTITRYYDRNRKNRIKKEWSYSQNSGKKLSGKYYYNRKGQEIKKKYYDGKKKLIDICKREYNDKGLLSTISYENKNKIKTTITNYEYNDKDQVIKIESQRLDIGKTNLTTYAYHENGLEKENAMYDEKGELLNQYTTEYKAFDQQGNWTVKEVINSKNKNQVTRIVRTIEYHK